MIILTRLNGEKFAVNPDLLERVDSTPDTVLTLLDGTKFMVAEPLTTVIDEVRAFRASVIAAARMLGDEPVLTAVQRAPSLPSEVADALDDDAIAPAVPLRRSRRP